MHLSMESLIALLLITVFVALEIRPTVQWFMLWGQSWWEVLWDVLCYYMGLLQDCLANELRWFLYALVVSPWRRGLWQIADDLAKIWDTMCLHLSNSSPNDDDDDCKAQPQAQEAEADQVVYPCHDSWVCLGCWNDKMFWVPDVDGGWQCTKCGCIEFVQYW